MIEKVQQMILEWKQAENRLLQVYQDCVNADDLYGRCAMLQAIYYLRLCIADAELLLKSGREQRT